MNFKPITVTEEDAGKRLDVFLTKHSDIGSRSHSQRLIEENKVKVNGKKAKASHRVVLEDEILLSDPVEEPKIAANVEPEDMDLDIVFEDEDIIVVNKPVGLVTHPSPGNPNGTLVNGLLHKIDIEDGLRPGIVHRLDKDTSGLLVVAKNLQSQRKLAEQFKEKTAFRLYWALCFGRPKEEKGVIESYLDRHPKDRKRFASSSNETGKHAVTHFRVLSPGEISLIELQLETGRTHQIRVHLSENGHPIFGDPIYGQPKRLNGITDPILKSKLKKIKRMALIAKELKLIHPTSNESLSFKIEWPREFENLIDE